MITRASTYAYFYAPPIQTLLSIDPHDGQLIQHAWLDLGPTLVIRSEGLVSFHVLFSFLFIFWYFNGLGLILCFMHPILFQPNETQLI